MGVVSGISWTDATWNPLVGCTSVSPGCDNCYARTLVDTRLHPAALVKGGRYLEAFPAPFDTVSIRPDRFLYQPLHWADPRMVFVNSLSDLFHEAAPMEFIARVFAVMAVARQHRFQLLTKRHGRAHSLLTRGDFQRMVWAEVAKLDPRWDDAGSPLISQDDDVSVPVWPLPNVWLVVSVEDQKRAGLRIDPLRRSPAALRGLSLEPLLGPVDLAPWFGLPDPRIDWVIVGGESGPGARLMSMDWVEAIAEQCAAAGVAYFFKQTGSRLARVLGLPGKGDDPADWPDEPWARQEFPEAADGAVAG
jgi:protein gp37